MPDTNTKYSLKKIKVWREPCRWAVREGLCEEVIIKLRFESQKGATMGEEPEKQRSWPRQGLIQNSGGWTEHSVIKDQEVHVADLERVTGG